MISFLKNFKEYGVKKSIFLLSLLGFVLGLNADQKEISKPILYAKNESYPSYYADLERIVLRDSMAELFGVNELGILSYGLDDLAKAEGHICPIITGAYLITREALKELKSMYSANPTPNTSSYDATNEVFYRGGFKVKMLNPPKAGHAPNAMAKAIGIISGADGTEGFKGPGFPFSNRNSLMFHDKNMKFDPKTGIEVIFTTMKADFKDKETSKKLSLKECKAHKKGQCIEVHTCDKSVKVTYKFSTSELLGSPKLNKTDPWPVKIKHIIDNYNKAIKVEKVPNPTEFCS